MEIKVQVKKLHEDAKIPEYQSEGAAALDLHACFYGVKPSLTIRPGRRALIKSGIAMAIPEGYMGIVTPRSGLSIKNGITVTNSPGIIDSDYRGDIGTVIQNTETDSFEVKEGDRISQLTLIPIVRGILEEVAELPETVRGEGGFGHTGL